MSKAKTGNPPKQGTQVSSKTSTIHPKTVKGSVPRMVNPPSTPTKKK